MGARIIEKPDDLGALTLLLLCSPLVHSNLLFVRTSSTVPAKSTQVRTATSSIKLRSFLLRFTHRILAASSFFFPSLLSFIPNHFAADPAQESKSYTHHGRPYCQAKLKPRGGWTRKIVISFYRIRETDLYHLSVFRVDAIG